MSTQALAPNGDKDKAMQAVYETVVGEGSGAGHEAESFLPLGSDMTVRIQGLKDQLQHALEVFGGIAGGVRLSSWKATRSLSGQP